MAASELAAFEGTEAETWTAGSIAVVAVAVLPSPDPAHYVHADCWG